MRRRHLPFVFALIASAALGACGVGSSEGGGGHNAINWYVFNEPGGSYDKAVADCNKAAGGKYHINYVKLPTDANQQRELIVRRLAAKDKSIDLIGMDVIWTAELAEAGWILPWKGHDRDVATQGKLEGPLKTVEYKGQVYGLPFTSNTQLLWYRKDKVDAPAEDFTWDEMIDDAVAKNTHVEVQGRQYEGLTVWINALIAGAGGQIVDQAGNVKVNDTAKRAAEIESKLGKSKAAPPGMSTNAEDQARQGFESGRSYYEVNYPFVYPSAAAVGKDFQKNMGWARYPRTDKDKPSRPPLGGINLGVSKYGETPDLAFQAAECIASDKHQAIAAELGGLPPTTTAVYDTPQVKKAYPFADVLRASIEAAAPRPVTPAYSDISLAIQKTYSPPDGIDPNGIVKTLRDRIAKAAEGKIF
ncbi:MAG: trehalose/maltose transport system substrate-binding protein [Thermoleophilaceae bacterium]|nr:trehalose/maltose transport system substrate-binding protein [Thermoleophilaceae bacterium]MEA2455160.1 trehalose/maltose transport system substrate-binding protein [Thermoleophilaceae bacterium]